MAYSERVPIAVQFFCLAVFVSVVVFRTKNDDFFGIFGESREACNKLIFSLQMHAHRACPCLAVVLLLSA